MLLDMSHICLLSEPLIREGPARPEEGLDNTSFTPQEHAWCMLVYMWYMLLDMSHVCLLSESLIREGLARPEEGPDSTSFTLLGFHAWIQLHRNMHGACC